MLPKQQYSEIPATHTFAVLLPILASTKVCCIRTARQVLAYSERIMWLNRKVRNRVASLFAALYAFCLVAPAIAFAFSSPALAAHCLTEHHHSAANLHTHAQSHSHDQGVGNDVGGTQADETAAQKSDQSQHENSGTACCGLFCFVTLNSDIGIAIERPPHSSPELVALEDSLVAHGPARIIRPPITLLSF